VQQAILPPVCWAILKARRARLRRFGGQRRCCAPIDHRTKTEHLATILLPNSVAAHDIGQDAMDGRAKIFRENNTA
jgi:hypothetical protein